MTAYLLLGDDEERKARGVRKLRQSRDASSFDAAETSPEEVMSACESFSIFGGGPFVVVCNLDAWNAAQKGKLAAYLEKLAPEADLVLLSAKLGAREKLLTAAKKSGEVHELEQPKGKALAKWAVGYAKKQDLELPEDVARNLVERCSEDKVRITREVEKLALYVGEGSATLEDVEALSPPDVESNIFAFVDALAAGDRGKAMKLLEDLAATGEPALRLLYMIRRQFRLVSRAKALFSGGASRNEVAKELKVPPFVARKLEEQSRKMSTADLERALDVILVLERGLKGGSELGDGLQVELAVMELSGS